MKLSNKAKCTITFYQDRTVGHDFLLWHSVYLQLGIIEGTGSHIWVWLGRWYCTASVGFGPLHHFSATYYVHQVSQSYVTCHRKL